MLPLTNPKSLPVISFHAVKQILLSLDISKAYGQDGIPPRVFKECALNRTCNRACSFVSFLFENPNFSSFLETCLSTVYFKEGWSFIPFELPSHRSDFYCFQSLWMSSQFPFSQASWISVFYLTTNVVFTRQDLQVIYFLTLWMSGPLLWETLGNPLL